MLNMCSPIDELAATVCLTEPCCYRCSKGLIVSSDSVKETCCLYIMLACWSRIDDVSKGVLTIGVITFSVLGRLSTPAPVSYAVFSDCRLPSNFALVSTSLYNLDSGSNRHTDLLEVSLWMMTTRLGGSDECDAGAGVIESDSWFRLNSSTCVDWLLFLIKLWVWFWIKSANSLLNSCFILSS